MFCSSSKICGGVWGVWGCELNFIEFSLDIFVEAADFFSEGDLLSSAPLFLLEIELDLDLFVLALRFWDVSFTG